MPPVDAFLDQLTQHIREGQLLPPRTRMVVAVSGGLDSMALLAALDRLRAEFDWHLEAAHFNHQLRGRAADADERLVRSQCAVLDIHCHTGHWEAQVKAAAVKAGGIEQAARLARRAFLGATAASAHADHVVLAHHADDQVEHFFVRLLRGAGSLGLGGMRPRVRHGPPLNAWLVRPLLRFRRAEIAAWAAERGVKYREDASNRDARFLRNRVRHQLLPYLTKHFTPAAPGLVLRTMTGLADEAAWLREAAADYLRQPVTERPAFDACAPALQRHALALQLEARQLKFDWDLIESLRTGASSVVNGPGGHRLSRDARGMLIIHPTAPAAFESAVSKLPLGVSRGNTRFEGLHIDWSLVRPRRSNRFHPDRECFDAGRVGSSVTLRHWRAGDRFQPIGMDRSVKLQNLFTNAKVPVRERRRRVVATTAQGDIFWVEGLRIAEPFKLTPATKKILVWRWRHLDAPGPPA